MMKKNKPQDYELLANISSTNDRLAFMEKLAGLGYWEIDVKNRKIYCSDEVYHILGKGFEGVKTLNLADVMPPEDYEKFFKNICRLYHRKIKFFQEARLITSNQSMRNCQLRADFFYIRNEAVIAGTIQDLSDVFETKKQLIEAKKHAEKLNKDKSYFLAQASHDLRQPMHALSLYLDLFHTDNLNKTQQSLWEKINNTADSLKSLLNNVLDLSRLDYGGTFVANGRFNIGLLLSDVGKEFADIAEYKNIVFEFSICNCQVCSDAFLVERILRNLLSNAFKFASKKVEVRCTEFKDTVKIDVIDDGIGIGKEDQKYIFDEFYRGKNVHERKIDGAGLGLAIVKKIANLIHTEIKVSSKLGKGSVFSFNLSKTQAKKAD